MVSASDWIEQLKDDDVRTRSKAAQSLGQHNSREVISALATIAHNDNHILVSRTAALSLGKIGGCEVLQSLVGLLEHDNLWMRKAAVQALGMAGCGDAVPVLVNMLADKDLYTLAREALVALKVNPDFF